MFKREPARYMTEAPGDDVQSVCKLLCALTALDECAELFDAETAQQQQQQRSRRERKAEPMGGQLSAVALGLLAEAVSRRCRRVVRADAQRRGVRSEDEVRRRISRAMRIDDESVLQPLRDDVSEPRLDATVAMRRHSGAYDADAAARASARFFADTRSVATANCSAFAVVGCLGFARVVRKVLRDDDGVEPASFEDAMRNARSRARIGREVARAFALRRITMQRFIRRALPGVDPTAVQSALYLQGLRFHTSATRREGLAPLCAPVAVLQSIAQDERAARHADLCAEKARRNVAALRDARNVSRGGRRRMQRAVFDAQHIGAPRMFSWGELEELNRFRDPNDQLVLCAGVGNMRAQHHRVKHTGGRATLRATAATNSTAFGLLQHRCCYPTCPLFLEDLRTSRDFALGTRHGLHQHLAPVIWAPPGARQDWCPGWQQEAKRVLPTCSSSNAFVAHMASFVKKYNQRAPRHRQCEDLDAFARSTWASYGAMRERNARLGGGEGGVGGEEEV
jgi:hypothetical protein